MTAVDRVDYSSSNSSDSLNKTGVSWRGRAVRYARMAPALFCLILTVIGACSAVFSSMPWMCIPFLVGSIASGYLMHLAGKFDQHKSLGSALGKMKTNLTKQKAQIDRTDKLLKAQSNQIERLKAIIGGLDATAEGLEATAVSLQETDANLAGHVGEMARQMRQASQDRQATLQALAQASHVAQTNHRDFKDELGRFQQTREGLGEDMGEFVDRIGTILGALSPEILSGTVQHLTGQVTALQRTVRRFEGQVDRNERILDRMDGVLSTDSVRGDTSRTTSTRSKRAGAARTRSSSRRSDLVTAAGV